MKYSKFLDGKEIGIDKTKKSITEFDFFSIYKPESGISKNIYLNKT
jgi:hypothetical protein